MPVPGVEPGTGEINRQIIYLSKYDIYMGTF
jgi:hypothetical protein